MMKSKPTTRFKIARVARGVSSADLADETGLSRQSLSAIENGKSVPKIETIAVIASALDVTPAWLVGWTEDGGPKI